MIRRILAATLLLGATLAPAADLSWSSGQRLVIAGDSITDAQKYSHYLMAYLHLRFPEYNLHLHSYGRGGTSMGAYIQGSGTDYEEYAKVVQPFAADYTSFMFGHNGGLSSDAWQADYEALLAEAEASPTAPLLFGPQPQSNATGKTSLGGTAMQPSADGYSTRMGILAAAGPYPFADTWNTLWPVFTNASNWAAIQYPGTQGTPQTHPGTTGHVMIAYTIITQLGWGANVSAATIAANTNTTTASTDCVISSLALTAAGGAFNRLDERLPWAIDEAGRADAVSMIPAMAGWQSYTMTITGLTAGTYTIKCDGVVIGSATHTELAAGWNMADLTTGPVWDQCQEVLGRVRDAQGVNRTTLANKSPNVGMVRYVSNAKVEYKTNGLRGAPLKAALADEIAAIDALDALIWSAAEPVTRTYSIEGATGAAPVVTITAPASPPTEDAGTPITFTATATDTEDGNLASSVVWTSSIDGALGTGASVSPTLTAGFHTVTATVTDSASNESQDTITATINAPTVSDYTPPHGIPSPLWGALDPITEYAPPAPAGWPTTPEAGYYYIDNTHGSATDSSNTYGTPNQPRLTIPETGFAAGARVEVHGGPYRWSASDAELDLTGTGTQADPIWFLGNVGGGAMAELQGSVEFGSGSSYMIFDGFRHTLDTVNDRMPSFRFGGDSLAGHHLAMRNCVVDGGGGHRVTTSSYSSQTGAAVGDVHDIVIYGNTVTGLGSYTYAVETAEEDYHAFHPGPKAFNVWILENVVSYCGGDFVQVNGNGISGTSRAHHVYIGRNQVSYMGENAVDVKDGVDIIVSGNDFGYFTNGQGSDGSAIVAQSQGGDGSDNIWILFNRIHHSIKGMRPEDNTANFYGVGNVLFDLTDATVPAGSVEDGYSAAIVARGASTLNAYFIDNTVARYQHHGQRWKSVGTAPNFTSSGNIFQVRSDSGGYETWGQGNTTGVISIDRNLYPAGERFFYSTGYTSLASWLAATPYDDNSAAGDALFTDAAADNFGIRSTSPASGINTKHAAYDAFETRYGLDIRFDISGAPRPASGAWDTGAYEATEGSATAGSVTAVTLNVGP